MRKRKESAEKESCWPRFTLSHAPRMGELLALGFHRTEKDTIMTTPFLVLDHLLKTWLTSLQYQGFIYGPWLFLIVEMLVFFTLAERWYEKHKESMGQRQAANITAWMSSAAFALMFVELAIWMNF
jgi:hypothetical protein